MSVSSTFTSSSGDGYEVQMGRWSRRLAPLFVEFAGSVSGERVLDVGCGTGNLSIALAQNSQLGNVLGLDFSPAYIEHAKRRNVESRIEFLVGDACALPFPNSSFDHALSMLVLQFVPRVDQAVREMRRVTRPGGTVAAATWDTRGGLVFYRIFFDTAAMIDPSAMERRAKAYSRPMTRPGDLACAWNKAGLQEVIEETRTIRMDFSSFADFWAPNEGKDGPIAEYLGTLSAEIRRKIRDAVELAYIVGEPDGPRSFAATALVVRGKVPTDD